MELQAFTEMAIANMHVDIDRLVLQAVGECIHYVEVLGL
jgi:hypothetical protein